MFNTLIFDLDDTLYPPSCGIWDMISGRIHQFMIERVGIPDDQAAQIRKNYFTTYGTTMRGLIIHHQIEPAEYLAFVHDIPVLDKIDPNPDLRQAIEKLPYQKFIFTNSDRSHAHRILRLLNIDDLFSEIIDVMDVFPACKPMPEAFQTALEKISHQPQECIFIDDSIRNLDEAHKQGFYTVMPNAAHTKKSTPHAHLKNLIDLKKVLP